MSCLLFSKSSANVSLPLGPSKTYCLSTFSHGSSRRCRLSSSRSRVNSFSFARNAVRAESHSSCETTGWALILLLPSLSCASLSFLKISSHRFPIEEAPVGVDDRTQRTDFSCLGNADFVIRNIDLHKLN